LGRRHNPTWTISDLSTEFAVTPRTLRYYEELGLLSPRRSGDNGQRLYDRRDREELLDLYDTDPTQKEQIRRTLEIGEMRIAEIDEMIEELQLHRQELLDYRDRLLRFLEGKASPEELDLPVEEVAGEFPASGG